MTQRIACKSQQHRSIVVERNTNLHTKTFNSFLNANSSAFIVCRMRETMWLCVREVFVVEMKWKPNSKLSTSKFFRFHLKAFESFRLTRNTFRHFVVINWNSGSPQSSCSLVQSTTVNCEAMELHFFYLLRGY